MQTQSRRCRPSDGVRSRWSGFRVQGTADSPPSATGQGEPSNGAPDQRLESLPRVNASGRTVPIPRSWASLLPSCGRLARARRSFAPARHPSRHTRGRRRCARERAGDHRDAAGGPDDRRHPARARLRRRAEPRGRVPEAAGHRAADRPGARRGGDDHAPRACDGARRAVGGSELARAALARRSAWRPRRP